jgi:hypothetical protein
MRNRKVGWLVAGSVLLLLAAIGISAYYTAPVWRRDSLTSYETVRLVPFRLFESIERCDICPSERIIGTWSRTTDGIALHAFGSSTTRRLVTLRKGACQLLMGADELKALDGYNPLAAYVLVGDPSCPEGAPVHPSD